MRRIPGGDIAGEVIAVGSGVDRSWVGTRCWSTRRSDRSARSGAAHAALCEQIAVDASQLIALATA